ncbi:MAG TPA: hypothetical protein VH482_27395 [Thermomicrobiales bacterium]
MNRLTDDQVLAIGLAYEDGTNLIPLSIEYGVSVGRIVAALEELGITRRGRGRPRKTLPATITDEYKAGATIKELADKYATTPATVSAFLHAAGVHVKRRGSTWSKLTDDQVLEARERYANGETCRALGEEFGVSGEGIRKAILGLTYTHLPNVQAPSPNGHRRLVMKEADVIEARTRYAAGETITKIAAEFGLTPSVVGHAVTGRTWGWLPGAVEIRALTDDEVIEARQRYADGESLPRLGQAFGHGDDTLRNAITGKTHSHLPNPVEIRSKQEAVSRAGAVLHEAEVLDIRRRVAKGADWQELADEYHVEKSNIGHIVSGRTWKHLPLDGSIPDRPLAAGRRLAHTPKKVLDEATVLELRKRYGEGMAADRLADEFGLNRQTVRFAVTGRTWKHLPGVVRKRNGVTPPE